MRKFIVGLSTMFPIISAHIELAPGLVTDLAHLDHARLFFFHCDEIAFWLVLRPRKLHHQLPKILINPPAS